MEFRIADTPIDSLTQLTGEEQLRAAQRLSVHRGVSAVRAGGAGEKISVAESLPIKEGAEKYRERRARRKFDALCVDNRTGAS